MPRSPDSGRSGMPAMVAPPREHLSVRTFLRLSVLAALVTIALKTAAWGVTGSVGLLSDAMESLVNLAAALFGLAMVSIAQAPADAEHPYGHSKAEYFASGFEAMMIVGAAITIIWAAVSRWFALQPLEELALGVGLSAASSVVNGVLAVAMRRAARAHDSIALEADARHLMTDVWTTAGVAGGVLLVPVTGLLWLDPLLAVLVALNILREGYGLLRRSVDGLMDRALSLDERERIDMALESFASEEVRFDHLRTRRAAGAKFCQLHMHVPGNWTLARSAAKRLEVEHRLMAAVGGLRVTIELLPAGHEPAGVHG
jgi:cation diffusion facilitator family transporter